MSDALFVALLIGFLFFLAACAAFILAPRLGTGLRLAAVLILTAVALICLFGFVATLEPIEHRPVWRILYGTVFVVCVSVGFRLIAAKRINAKDEQA